MRKLIPVAALALVALGGEVSSAQTVANPITFQPSVFAGVALPTGDFGSGVNTGYTLGAGLDLHTGTAPLSWRADASYSSFGAQGGGATISDFSGRANAVLSMPSTGFSPYAIGGIGIYHVNASVDFGSGFSGSTSENDFGWNIGAGIDFPIGEIAGRLEVRYNSVNLSDNSKYTYVPITFGIRF